MPTIATFPNGIAGAVLPRRAPTSSVVPAHGATAATVATISSAIDIRVVASVAIGGHRAVCLTADGTALIASADDVACALCLGLTLGAAAAGATVVVRRLGEIDDPAFAFAIGPVWLGLAGALTQIRPTTGLLLPIGLAIGPTRLLVHPRPATLLAT